MLVRQYLKSLAKKLNTTITVESVSVSFFNNVTIDKLYVEDLDKDTLLYAEQLVVDIDEFSISNKEIILDEVELGNSYFNLKKYEEGTNLTFIAKHFAKNDTTENEWDFGVNEVFLNSCRFDYNNITREHNTKGVDFNHLSLSNVNADIIDIRLFVGVECEIKHLSLQDKSGFKLEEFIADAKVSQQGVFTENLTIETPNTRVKGIVGFGTESYSDFKNFFEDVKINTIFEKTELDFRDLAYFVPTLNNFNKKVVINGNIRGRMSNLKARKLSLVFNDGTRFAGNIDLSGLPNPDDMFWYVDVEELSTNKQRIESFPLFPFNDNRFVELSNNFRHLGTLRFTGNFTGFMHDFVAYGNLKTSLGNIDTDVSVKIKEGIPYYKGEVVSNHFGIGRLLEIPKELGDITMNISVDGKGFTKKDLDANFKGKIDQIVVKDYEYNNVDLNGNFKNKIFKGYLAVKDENIAFDFNGEVNVANEVPEFHFLSNINDAKLAKLNLIDSKKKLKTRFSTRVAVNMTGNHIDNLIGDIQFSNSRYEDLLDTIIVDTTFIESKRKNKTRSIKIKSDLLDAEVKGEFSFKEIADYSSELFLKYIPSEIEQNDKLRDLAHDVNFQVELHNSELLSKVFLKDFEISDYTVIEGNYTSNDKLLAVKVNSPFINAKGIKVNNFSFNAEAGEEVLQVWSNASKIYSTDSLAINNFSLNSVVSKDSLINEIIWDDKASQVTEAKIKISSVFNGFDSISTRVLDSYAYISDSLWTIKSTNLIKSNPSSISFKGLSVSSASQKILIDGRLSNDPLDQIDILFKKFDLITLQKIIPPEVIQVEGVLDGVASVSKQNEELIFTTDMEFEKFRINDKLIGKGELESKWNNTQQSLKLDGKFYRDHIPSILFGGYYYPTNEEESIDMNFELNRTELGMFSDYVKDNISGLNGTANASVSITGNFTQPKLSGNISLLNTSFKVNYLNTIYRTHHCKINIIPDMISFDNVEIIDQRNNIAHANGTILHEWFKDFSIDIGIDAKNFMALNTTEKENSLYYGKAFVSGFIDIGSYEKQMLIDADIKTEKNTVINIPLEDSEDIEENNFIEFVSHDSTDFNVVLEEEVDLTNIEMNFDMEITPEAQVRLIFDEQIGDVMRSTGSGNLTLNISNDGDLNMFGNYIVKDGDYLFTLQNVINKRFDLEEGGTIKWSGSPYDAEIDLTAVYRLRARLYDLLVNVDTSDVYKKRIPVDLKLHMGGAMMNPDINFDIDLPTADEDTKNKVKSVLYVSDKEENIQELNKQVFSLLVLKSFLPPQGANAGYGRASVGSTTSSELLSNQLSNWLSAISNDFDIGLNYTPGDELSGQQLELALSTQLFNDRLVLDGNFGVSENQNVSSSSQNTNNLLGDISVEYKITKDGKLRAKGFNNSNQFTFQNNNSAYTQGLGLSYKEEYNTGKEFWQKFLGRFRKKNKKQK